MITAIKRRITIAMIGTPINIIEPMSQTMVTTKRLTKDQTMISTITSHQKMFVTTSTIASMIEQQMRTSGASSIILYMHPQG